MENGVEPSSAGGFRSDGRGKQTLLLFHYSIVLFLRLYFTIWINIVSAAAALYKWPPAQADLQEVV